MSVLICLLGQETYSQVFQVIIFLFDWILGVMTIQLPLDFHLIFSYLKPHGLTWDQGGSLLVCLMSLCFKYHLNPLRQSKVIGPPVQGTEFGY